MSFLQLYFVDGRRYPQWRNLSLALFLDLSQLLAVDFLFVPSP